MFFSNRKQLSSIECIYGKIPLFQFFFSFLFIFFPHFFFWLLHLVAPITASLLIELIGSVKPIDQMKRRRNEEKNGGRNEERNGRRNGRFFDKCIRLRKVPFCLKKAKEFILLFFLIWLVSVNVFGARCQAIRNRVSRY